MVTAFAFLVFMLAGLVKGVVGMGLPTVAIGLLALAMAPVDASALLLIPSMVTNIWQLLAGPSPWALCKRLLPMMATLFVGVLLTSAWLVDSGSGWIPAVLGVILILYGLLGLSAVRFHAPAGSEGVLSPVIGFITGLVAGLTGVFAIPAVPYLQALGLQKEDLIQALGLSFTVATVALGAGIWLHGGMERLDLGLSCLMLLPALLGMWIGQWVRVRLSEALFRRVFFMGLIALGAHSLVRAIA
jgi:uncharacterized membrane protein YfcA